MLVAGPNIVGLALGILQLFLRAIFPAKCVSSISITHACLHGTGVHHTPA